MNRTQYSRFPVNLGRWGGFVLILAGLLALPGRAATQPVSKESHRVGQVIIIGNEVTARRSG